MPDHRLLFLALSGVRVREPELLALGMTLPGFVERGKTIAQLPALGLLTLAALTPPHWQVEYRELDGWTSTDVEEIAAAEFEVVAISALTARILDAYAIADQLRRHGITVILGGLHVSALPEEAVTHADAIVIGEGEEVWQQVLLDYDNDGLRPFYRSNGRFNFADAPLPRYDLLNPDSYNRLTIQTTRGCPLDCQFCGASRLISRYKQKPIELVQRGLEQILSLWLKPFIELADDNTFVNKAWSRELVKLLGKYPVRWFTETDISVADDPELLELLAESGCAQLLVGLESASPAALDGVDSRNWKRRRQDDYIASIARIQSYGISVNGCLALGFDSNDNSIFEITRDFVINSGLSEVQITVLTPFPGTELYRKLRDEKRLLADKTWDSATLFDVMFQPARMSVTELEQGFAWLMKELYNDKESARRQKLFKDVVRRGRVRN